MFYSAAANVSAANFQPADSDLTAIAALSTTSFGRGLLTQADGADMRDYAGIPDALPLAGGTMTGAIKRNEAGAYGYAADPAITDVRFFFTVSGADDPRTQIGDIWFEEEPA